MSTKMYIFAAEMKIIASKIRYFVFAACLGLLSCQTRNASIEEVDGLVVMHRDVQNRYQAQLDSLAQVTEKLTNDTDLFVAYGELFDKYRSFNIDSQRVYVEKRQLLASRMDSEENIQMAAMNHAEVMMRSGMYHETICSLDSISKSGVHFVLRPYYYYLRRTLYGLMADFADNEQSESVYKCMTQAYRDSIIQVQPEGDFVRELVRADGLAASKQYKQALQVLAEYEASHTIEPDQVGMLSITRAQIYHNLGDKEAEKQHLIISASADLKEAKREYIALRELAVLLYREGDVDRAYRYMQCVVEDAMAGDMRGRSLEISTIYPIVEGSYRHNEILRTRLLYAFSGIVALLAILAFAFLIYSSRQRKKLASLNEQLNITNADLRESNHIKTVYVGHYMEMTSLLIDRFDTWRKSINQLLKSGDVNRAQSQVASQRFTQEQLNAFYRDFDEAFLKIFPQFVEQVRELLVDDAELRIKPGEKLNTDLRVLGCIRLGITDSQQIASFLRYSLSTIYNSRTRMRNLYKGNRDDFERKVATL